ncbi:YadA family autotransporter adhesin, partial [Neisseria mucosa]|uniref:YadA family autotransporter adhesin n=1 Tax=Neisseria mucosa TaxID=488 RepID=UPI0018CDE715
NTTTTIVKDGATGAKGDTGATGADGKNAEADVKDNGNGTHTVTIKDGNGNTTTTIVKDGATGAAGAKGDTGADGKNAKAEVKDNGNGTHTVTITDGEGKTTTTIVKDGVDGKNAKAEVKDNGNGTHTVTITDGEGKTTTTIVKDGATGATGAAGAKGDTGADGKNAKAEVKDNGNGTHTVTITDGEGKTTTTIVKDGADGKNAEADVKDNGDGTHTVTIKDGNGNTTTTIVKDGATGATGATGAKGDTGENGKSAEGKVERDEAKGTSTITINNFDKDGKVISTTTATVKDGKDGKDGKDADGTFGLVDETGTTDGSISKKLNNTIQIKGDAGTKVQVFDKATGKTSEKEVQNIFVKKDGDALKVSLNPDLTVNSVTTNELKAGPVTINQGGIDAGNTTIKNVAPGKNGTDAVNVDQLNQKFGDVNSNVNKVDNNARAGVAQALATAGLPQAYLPGKSMLAIGGGHYRGETGYAVGFSSISDGGNWIIKGTASGNSRGHFGATAAVGYQW